MVPELLGLLGGEPFSHVCLLEAVLLLGETVDLVDDLLVVHDDSFARVELGRC